MVRLSSKYLAFMLMLIPVALSAQKVHLGTATVNDGGKYTGELTGSKPNGKGVERRTAL